MSIERRVSVLVVCVALSLAPRPAEAWIGALIKAAAKVGSVGARAAGAGARAAGAGARAAGAGAKAAGAGAKAAGAGAKAGFALKGAATLGTTVAAERVFLSMADDVGRIGVYVADDGAGALSVVMRGGDEATHSAASLRGLISDLDEMAKVADDAGVDVFVDPNALGRLDALATGPNTRLFLANTEGPSWPIRAGAVHPELGVGPRAWLEVGRLERSALELVLQLASGPLISPSGPIRVLDADCGGATDPALSELSVATHLDEIVGGAQPGEVVWVLAEADPAPGEVAQLARDHGIDLVVLGIGEVCLPDHAVDQGLAPTLEEVHGARTLGQLWSVGRGGASRVITRIEPDASQLGLIGEGLVSVHRLATLQGPAIAAVSLEAAVAGPGPSVVGLDEPEPAPLWFWGLLGVMPVGMIVAGGLLVRTHQHNATS